MLMPKKIKHRKWQQGRIRGEATSSNAVDFGSFGLKSLDAKWITSRQIEAARRAMSRCMKRGGRVWIRIFPHKPITFHGNENTMGTGKGAVEYYVAVVKPGTVMFEIDGVEEAVAKEALTLAGHKLPVRTKVVAK